MQFFHKNPDQDKIFLIAYSKINLAYWIASDVDFFHTNFKNELNEFEFLRLKSQYDLAINIFNEGLGLIDLLNKNHYKAAKLLSKFTFEQIQEFRIDKAEKPYKNSELEEIELQEEISAYDEYVDSFSTFLNQNSLDLAFYKSNRVFLEAMMQSMKVSNEMDCYDLEETLEGLEDIADKMTMSRIYLKEKPEHLYKDAIFEEYSISISGSNNEPIHSFESIFKSSMNYINAWDSYIAHYENYFKSFNAPNSHGGNDTEEDTNFFHHEDQQLSAAINSLAIEATLKFLENLNQEIPYFEIYSARKVANSINYLIDQTVHQIAK
jgi:hypothetical protein